MGIQVDHLSKFYGDRQAVKGISFEVKPGEILGFLGPNGAGKSTTMKILAGYLPQTSGSAAISGFDTLKDSLAVRKRIGYLPENNALYHEMYVKEFLSFIADIHQLKDKKARIAEVIALTGLTVEQNKKIGELSKGYKQRVGIAQAIIHDPEVLILDEPTSGLDPNQLIEIRNLIKKLGETKTVIFSTHIMQEVEAICSQVIIIHKGEIVANDSVAHLLAHHQEKSIEPIFVKLTQS
jgi:ABC-2 type transport system ATP-binding protein